MSIYDLFMRLFYVLIIICLFGTSNAQVCTFMDSEVDSVEIITPAPYHPDLNPDGGIEDEACLNEAYSTKFVIYVPPTIPGFPLPIDSITLNGDGVRGLPTGLDEETNTPNGVFYPDQADCLIITGTPDSGNPTGEYELEIDVLIYIPGLGAQPFTFPDPAITGEGKYILTLNEEGQCVTNTGEVDRLAKSRVELLENPVTSTMELEIESSRSSEGSIQIVSMFGQELKRKNVRLHSGVNSVEINLIDLPQGIFFMKYKDPTTELTKRFHIVKP